MNDNTAISPIVAISTVRATCGVGYKYLRSICLIWAYSISVNRNNFFWSNNVFFCYFNYWPICGAILLVGTLEQELLFPYR